MGGKRSRKRKSGRFKPTSSGESLQHQRKFNNNNNNLHPNNYNTNSNNNHQPNNNHHPNTNNNVGKKSRRRKKFDWNLIDEVGSAEPLDSRPSANRPKSADKSKKFAGRESFRGFRNGHCTHRFSIAEIRRKTRTAEPCVDTIVAHSSTIDVSYGFIPIVQSEAGARLAPDWKETSIDLTAPDSKEPSTELTTSPADNMASEITKTFASIDVNTLRPIIPPSFHGKTSKMRLFNGQRLTKSCSVEFQEVKPLQREILSGFLLGQVHPTTALLHVCQNLGFELIVSETAPQRKETKHAFVSKVEGRILAIAEGYSKKDAKKVVARRTLLALFGKTEEDLFDLDPAASYQVMVDSRGRRLIVKEFLSAVSGSEASAGDVSHEPSAEITGGADVDRVWEKVSLGTTGDVLDLEEKVNKLRTTNKISTKPGQNSLAVASFSVAPPPTGVSLVVLLRQLCKEKEWPIVFNVSSRDQDARGQFHCRLWICCEPIASGYGVTRTQAMNDAANASLQYMKKVLPPGEMDVIRPPLGVIRGVTASVVTLTDDVLKSAEDQVNSIQNIFHRLSWKRLVGLLYGLGRRSFPNRTSTIPVTMATFLVRRSEGAVPEVVALGIEERLDDELSNRVAKGRVTAKKRTSALTLARRALLFFFYDQIFKFYGSTDGDSIFEMSANDDGKLRLISGASLHLVLSIIDPPQQDRNRDASNAGNGRAHARNDFMKIWSWTILGVQGSVLSRVLDPIYLTSVNVNVASSSPLNGFLRGPEIGHRGRTSVLEAGFNVTSPVMEWHGEEHPRFPFPSRMCWRLTSAPCPPHPSLTSTAGNPPDPTEATIMAKISTPQKLRRIRRRPGIICLVGDDLAESLVCSARCFSRTSLLQRFARVLLHFDYDSLLAANLRQGGSLKRRRGLPVNENRNDRSAHLISYAKAKGAARDFFFVKKIVNQQRDYLSLSSD